ncbi:glutamate-1-semialdehyde 2,1-aminomutase [Halarsenatibacter silvermanii]|uniref:Glutamate-1-semialdehyde 2,1-aminomutase n=2 Tax=Halarsenatibacter silvermanii TaxID=321763 RepID=A0A1G9Q1B8_9FIRM|nr:glutamate-1-semialdehyde 2,1-aminomutase [Halarsenatibacter silvermanii]SDM04723.1 glutamate-1-semialdehyde 2,1-aminomutase [Halarsenatibacter silvermanii]
MFERSREEYERACQYLPGGVNSPARSFSSVREEPVFIERAEGSKVYDIDGNEYIDFVSSWGPMLFGHCQEDVIEAVSEQLDKGTSFGAPTIVETEMAEEIADLIPTVDRVRMVNSGTEATMSAVRLARGYTGRDKIIKFTGNYHGHGDSFLIKAGSGPATLGLPDSPGVPEDLASLTISVPYNDEEAIQKVFEKEGDDIAAVILEPVAANMGVVPPQPGFLEFLRRITSEEGAVLIFDEVMTGFRVAAGGAQEYYEVEPDLTCLGKIIGAGFPVGAFGGKAEIMDEVAPKGPVYQAGTLSGNPLAMTAGLEMMKLIQQEGVYEELKNKSDYLREGMEELKREIDLPLSINQVGSLLSLFFTDERVVDYETATSSDTELYAEYFQNMLRGGIYIAPSQFEAMFVSAAHSREELDETLEVMEASLKELE